MTDTTEPPRLTSGPSISHAGHDHGPGGDGGLLARLREVDRVWATFLAGAALLVILAPAEAGPLLRDTGTALLHTTPFIAFAVLSIAWLKAAEAEELVTRAFAGRESLAIVLAAFAGGLSPFCSCEVIPLVAALLAAGAPISAIMAFWLASPLMDPAAFAITAGAISPEMAVAKLVAALTIALTAGFATKALMAGGAFASPLRPRPVRRGCGSGSCCGGSAKPVPAFRFWQKPGGTTAFREAAEENALFLVKWLTLAYFVEVLMTRFIPAETIGAWVGGDGLLPILAATLLGVPAYLNGYAAPALVGGLMEQGMSPGAGLAFMVAGGVTCIPAVMAVWALVRPPIFAAYLGFGAAGALAAGFAANALL
ncbi:permease [Pseudoroseicyclus tamaricis]|uniref:Permease n=1 Tax=Pseudoroseicyclus tamaricis TaxID=2705421 RepID=A0A6B2JZW6_9RHOB|nr:permease [Pseudoroseicyclus tamaricis]NDV02209.1 permease [Pseudoroseicyclus tamaricis]